ncbi:MAG: GNAT family N-acetyltransferase [Streptococcaceae bacterium]|jgi:ribosomal protein S18 acetylase RimI-like enzyme|nr:GNAT family N-acetyltransferase [Streptococcaceae bacterium]
MNKLSLEHVVLRKITTKAEVERLQPLVEEIWREHFSAILGTLQVEYMLKNYQSPEVILAEIASGRRYYFVEKEAQIIGYIAYDVLDQSLYLSKLYLLKAFRGKGLMKEVLNYLEGLAKSFGLSNLFLRVNRENQLALKVYQKLGFELFRTHCTPIGPYFLDDYELIKRL